MAENKITDYGFVWEGIEVTRLGIVNGSRILRVKTENGPDLNIYVSPQGRSVRVYKEGKELK